MELELNRLLIIGLIFLVAGGYISLGISNFRKDNQNRDLVKVVTETNAQIIQSELWLTLAKGAAQGVPQDVFNQVYAKSDSLQQLVGMNTPMAQILEQLEDIGRRIDKDPTNDPQKQGETPVVNG
jgi:hypothetical protein